MGANASVPRIYDGAAQPPAGLRNLGNSCYMNSALQCLFQTHALNAALHTNVSTAFSRSYLSLLAGHQRIRQLYQVKKEMKKQGKQFAGFKQLDAEEFLLYFFERLIATESVERKSLEELFEVTSETSYSCSACKTEATTSMLGFFWVLPLTPAHVTLIVHPGEPSTAELTVAGSELMTSEHIAQDVRKQVGKDAVWLTVQTEAELVRVVSAAENLKQLNLLRHTLCYYAVEDTECLIEVKIYKKAFPKKQFLLYRVKKALRTALPAELAHRFREELSRELGMPVLALFAENPSVTCLPWGSREVLVEQSDFSLALQGKQPVLRMSAILEGTVPASPLPLYPVRRSEDVLELEHLLKAFEAEEPLADKYQCEVCQVETLHTKVSRLSHTSRYLLITLQR